MEEEAYVVGLGEILWDVLPSGRRLGGAPANFAYHAGQAGLRSLAVSAIGHDALADETLRALRAKGLPAYLERVPYPTGTVEVTLDDEGLPQYDILEGVAWDNLPFTAEMERIAQHTRAVCFGSLAQRAETSRRSIRAFLAAMPETPETLKVFDINLRQHFYSREVVEASLQAANVLKVNDEELPLLAYYYGLTSARATERCEALQQRFGLRLVICTCGAVKSIVVHEGGTSELPTPHVDVADTVGAGDSFTAAFCAALLTGHTIAEAHARAVRVAAYVCTQRGAMPPWPRSLTRPVPQRR